MFQLEDYQHARLFEEMCALLDAETPTPAETGDGISLSVPALGPTPLAFNNRIRLRGAAIEITKESENSRHRVDTASTFAGAG